MPIPRPSSDNYEYPSDPGIMGEDYEHDQSRFKEVTDEELKAFKKVVAEISTGNKDAPEEKKEDE